MSVIAPDIVAVPVLFEIFILPVAFDTAFEIVKPFNDEITTSLFVFDTVPAIFNACALFVFLIDIPSVADTLEVSVNVKLPFLFYISTVPSDVLTVDLISELVPFVVILILPFVFSTLPLIKFLPFVLEIVELPSPFITLPD